MHPEDSAMNTAAKLSITPEDFWRLYKQELRTRGDWIAYQGDRPWTAIATAAGIAACRQLGLQTGKEYFRLDVIGYRHRGDDPYNWDLDIAFEAENAANWKDEVCKLAHVVASLRVLVAYQLHRSHTSADALREYVDDLRDRMIRVPGCRWLFIFGPDWREPSACWEAWTLDHEGRVLPIPDSDPLFGQALGCSQQRPPIDP
jgi:hypothetical protein